MCGCNEVPVAPKETPAQRRARRTAEEIVGEHVNLMPDGISTSDRGLSLYVDSRHDHDAHIAGHMSFIGSTDAKTVPARSIQLLKNHIAKHQLAKSQVKKFGVIVDADSY